MKLRTEVELNGKKYPFEISLGARFRWEMITGQPFEPKTSMHWFIYFFCCFLQADEEFMDQDFKRFIAECEDDDEAEARMFDALRSLNKREQNMDGTERVAADSKKKG